jgi:hypothetical protein
MSSGQVFSASLVPTLQISSATVSIGAQAVNGAPTPIDMSAIDSSIINRIADSPTTQGAMYLTITNPFTLGGAMNVTFSSPAGSTPAITPITKTLTLTKAPTATTSSVTIVSIDFTGQELRRMLGHDLLVAFGGNTAAGALTVTPAQKITITSRLQMTLFIKEQ